MVQFYLLTLVFIVVDRFAKLFAINVLRDLPNGIVLVPDWFKLMYAENLGIAFGLRLLPPEGILLLALAISAGLTWYVWISQNRSPLFILTFALILGGGLGNLIDRLIFGHVVDFIYFDIYQGTLFGKYVSLWPIFNIADACITIGACLLFFFHDKIFNPR
ncbi:lipoprotein signal peptidase [Chlorobaculum parvum NCIB 8327]|uniref:Lipoprotein signal peptidase n=1 Tax=Chlorobaculum parvum (strain DSM 263 / NCIMB 8327) TaxID=517417 RepID=LSPA_CHLP8|nr:signal peptidase II [Chlorobaculum parvum]B3QQ42.1 RecName: Full=Lipoprotein signal peptidase; AltName: Full=Prolipoprotein signal peptidase; AltName: Full=Signal peptidase II; Short=SPase II [Chlorobaculum parvum NCIB 8327]ACF12045.1 lipoprotein signal peptidase [Chlorobaculum parvum NCIB 8327]